MYVFARELKLIFGSAGNDREAASKGRRVGEPGWERLGFNLWMGLGLAEQAVFAVGIKPTATRKG